MSDFRTPQEVYDYMLRFSELTAQAKLKFDIPNFKRMIDLIKTPEDIELTTSAY